MDPDKARQKAHRQRRVARAEGVLLGVLSQIGPGDLALDCGANTGTITTRLADTGAEVHAFEPDPAAAEALHQAVEGRSNVTLHRAAVGVADGTARLMRGEGFADDPLVTSRRSTIVPGATRIDPAHGVEVEVVDLIARLKTWAARPAGIAFLKLDVEGAELDILTEMLRHDLFAQIRLTVAELHPYKFPALRPEFQALRKTVAARYPETRVWLDWI
ncbi:MAG: FkbM family methyltransferase [Rhodobacter sp.]|nr:FkbM family methyltransferase [Rhodobacter sp.]